MSKAKVEDIKNDIRNLIKNLSDLKENPSEVLSESFEDLSGVMGKIKDEAKDSFPSKSSLLFKGISYFYGNDIKKAATIVGISAFLIYLINR